MLLFKMLHKNPSARPAPADILQEIWFVRFQRVPNLLTIGGELDGVRKQLLGFNQYMKMKMAI
jgi:hypothetical protein